MRLLLKLMLLGAPLISGLMAMTTLQQPVTSQPSATSLPTTVGNAVAPSSTVASIAGTDSPVTATQSNGADLFYASMTKMLKKQRIDCAKTINGLECTTHTGIKFTIPASHIQETQDGLMDGSLRYGTRQTAFFKNNTNALTNPASAESMPGTPTTSASSAQTIIPQTTIPIGGQTLPTNPITNR